MTYRTITIERIAAEGGQRTFKRLTDERPESDVTLSVVARGNSLSPMLAFEHLAAGKTLRTPKAVYRRIPR